MSNSYINENKNKNYDSIQNLNNYESFHRIAIVTFVTSTFCLLYIDIQR